MKKALINFVDISKSYGKQMVLDEFMSKKGTLITGIIQRRTDRAVIVNIGKTDAIMPQKEQIPREYYKPGNRIRVFVLNVKETNRLPQVIVSHAHAEIVRELFELEVPEIEDGIVEIKSISREAGYRTKIAVTSNDPDVDSVGACIGPRGSRIQTIIGELKNEKIDTNDEETFDEGVDNAEKETHSIEGEETLEDIEWASEEIASDLVEQLMEVEDQYILDVISTAAPTFDTTGTIFAGAIPMANYMDVLRVACAQIANGNFDANTVILNPADAAMMDLAKDSMGRYLWVKVDDRVWYLRIVESNNMTQGNFIVGDFSRANYRIRKDITMYAGREKDDLTKNLYTIVFELRGVSYIKENYKPAFVAGTFSTAISEINYEEGE